LVDGVSRGLATSVIKVVTLFPVTCPL